MANSLINRAAKFSLRNPNREVNWRSLRVDDLLRAGSGRCSVHDDRTTRELRRYRMALQAHAATNDVNYGRKLHHRLQEEFLPAILVDEMIAKHIDKPSTLLYIRARLLAGYDPEEIAALNGCMPEMIDWYEQVYFNVRDRLHAKDWVVGSILTPSYDAMMYSTVAGTVEPPVLVRSLNDPSLLTLAYFGGRFVCDTVISGIEQGYRPESADDVNKWFLKQFSSGLKRRAAQATIQMSVSKFNVTELFNVTCRVAEMEKNAGKPKGEAAAETLSQILLGLSRFSSGSEGARKAEELDISAFDDGAVELRNDDLLDLTRQRAEAIQERLEAAENSREKT